MNIRQCEWKLNHSVRVAREARRASWQEPGKDRKKYQRVSAEAMQDARYWSQQMLEGAV